MSDSTSPQLTAAADGRHTSSGTPHGFTSLTPFLVIASAKEAIAFYQDVFGARTVNVTEIGGVVVHAEVDFGHGRLQLGDDYVNAIQDHSDGLIQDHLRHLPVPANARVVPI